MLDFSPESHHQSEPVLAREVITLNGSVTNLPIFAVSRLARIVDRHEQDEVTEFTVERYVG